MATAEAGSVAAILRFPVKSMQGEELNAVEVTALGLLGDRAHAVVDAETGKVASAKNPSKWPSLLSFRAAFVTPPDTGRLPAVRITLPDGGLVSSDEPDASERLSKVLGRRVTLSSRPPVSGTLEEYWPDLEGLAHRDTVTDEKVPEGTFFDCAYVHLLTTATLRKLREHHPQGAFEVRRFRPNLVVEPPAGGAAFVENAWVGKLIHIGGVTLKVTGACGRCVMTTLPQSELPRDIDILKTAAKHNGVNVGVYATVVKGGRLKRADAVHLEP